MKTKVFLMVVAIAFSFAVASCGNKKAAEVGGTENAQACGLCSNADSAACANAADCCSADATTCPNAADCCNADATTCSNAEACCNADSTTCKGAATCGKGKQVCEKKPCTRK